jgi:hypothetical protein
MPPCGNRRQCRADRVAGARKGHALRDKADEDAPFPIQAKERRSELVADPEAAIDRRGDAFGVEAAGVRLQLPAVQVEGRFAAGMVAARDRQARDGRVVIIADREARQQLHALPDDPELRDPRPHVEARHHFRARLAGKGPHPLQPIEPEQRLYLDVGTAIPDSPDHARRIACPPGEAGAETRSQLHGA